LKFVLNLSRIQNDFNQNSARSWLTLRDSSELVKGEPELTRTWNELGVFGTEFEAEFFEQMKTV